jgi:hypothetical protein
MSEANPDLLVFALLRVVVLVVGLAFAYMGFRLFMSGLQNPSGDIEIEGGRFKVKVIRAAPGIFFALIGGAIVVYQVTRVLQYSSLGTQAQPVDQSAPEVQACDTCSNGQTPNPPPYVIDEHDPAPSPGVAICDTCSAPVQVPNNSAVIICDTCASNATLRPPVHTVICDTCSQPIRGASGRRRD